MPGRPEGVTATLPMRAAVAAATSTPAARPRSRVPAVSATRVTAAPRADGVEGDGPEDAERHRTLTQPIRRRLVLIVAHEAVTIVALGPARLAGLLAYSRRLVAVAGRRRRGSPMRHPRTP